jgi:uracil-DNA glycosylase
MGKPTTITLNVRARGARALLRRGRSSSPPVRVAAAAPASTHDFDPGYGWEPFRTLCSEYPGAGVYPTHDFRTEWGPIFHRGRLDGTAKLLVLGQDPAAHEAYVRRILVGEAGQRCQGFMARLGITRSYVLINTFLYSVVSQGGGAAHAGDPKIAAYRHRWIDAILASSQIEAVVALGELADKAWQQWRRTESGKAHAKLAYVKITHPTADAPRPGTDQVAATRRLLASWNAGLAAIGDAIALPDAPRVVRPYGDAWTPEDLVALPEHDFPAGLPAWMRRLDPWAVRGVPDDVPKAKRRVLTIVVPDGETP